MVRDSIVRRETNDRGKASIGQQSSPSYFPPERETAIPTTGNVRSLGKEEVTFGERREQELQDGSRRDISYYWLHLPVFDDDDNIT